MVERELREDCFANPRWTIMFGRRIIECDALKPYKGVDCGFLDCRKCSFYKPKQEEDAELLRRHGTTDLCSIVEKYKNTRPLRD